MEKVFAKLGFRKSRPKVMADQRQEVLIRLGRDQFKKLIEKGLSIPVVTL